MMRSLCSAGMSQLENSGTIAAMSTTLHTATSGYSDLCQTISQALERTTGTIEGPRLYSGCARYLLKYLGVCLGMKNITWFRTRGLQRICPA